MMENAAYIQQELPNVEMSEALRSRTAEICESLVGTKHDVLHELFEMDERLQAETEPAAGSTLQTETGQAAGSIRQTQTCGTSISARVDRVIAWLWEDISTLHQLVQDLREDSRKNDD